MSDTTDPAFTLTAV